MEKVIKTSALSAEAKAAIAAARSQPASTGQFARYCANCRKVQPVRGFRPDPAKTNKEVCAHCARLRTPKPRAA